MLTNNQNCLLLDIYVYIYCTIKFTQSQLYMVIQKITVILTILICEIRENMLEYRNLFLLHITKCDGNNPQSLTGESQYHMPVAFPSPSVFVLILSMGFLYSSSYTSYDTICMIMQCSGQGSSRQKKYIMPSNDLRSVLCHGNSQRKNNVSNKNS